MASEFDAIAGKVLNVGPIQVKMTKRIWSGRRHLKSNRKVSDGPGPFALREDASWHRPMRPSRHRDLRL